MRRLGSRVVVLLAVAVSLLLVLVPSPASAGCGTVGVWAGWQFSNEGGRFDGWKGGVDYEYRVGARIIPELQFALEVPFESWQSTPKVQTNLGGFHLNTTTWSIIPTAKVYWSALPELRPYIGAGVGYARTDFDDPIDDGENSLAWRAVAGAEYILPIKLPFWVFLEYQYTSVGIEDAQPILDLGDDSDLGGNAITGGIRFGF
ncbi:MAG: outer membrane beta-barrel protein [Pseudomonadota bacterium]